MRQAREILASEVIQIDATLPTLFVLSYTYIVTLPDKRVPINAATRNNAS